MHTKRNVFIAVFSFLVLTIFVLSGTYYYILNKQKILLDSTYNTMNTHILKLTENFIDNKTNTALAIALSLVKDSELHKLMASEEYNKFNYNDISLQIKENTKYKNIWIQIIDKNGNSVYRSWTDKKGDNLFFRKDLKKFIENKKVSTSISVGLYSMTIKARAPIMDEENNFLGAIEVIGNFNSISTDLKENKIDSVIIADKKYNEIIQLPFTKIFIDDYYIANENVNKELITYLQQNKIEKYLKIDNYIIENNYMISKYDLYNNKNERLGYILNFVKLSDIDIRIVESFKIQTIMISAIVLITMLFFFLIYLYTSYLRLLRIQKIKKKLFLILKKTLL